MIATSLQEFLELRASSRARLKHDLAIICEGVDSITLEIGCGHGHFLVAYAQAHPGELCIGFDILHGRIHRALAKVGKCGLTNVHFLKTDAELFFEALPDWVRIDKTFILFPDPWPKARHYKNRLIQDKYLNPLAQVASPNAKLYFRTDHEEYFSWSEEVIKNSAFWERSPSPWLFEHETVFQARMGNYQSLVAERIIMG